MEQKRERAVDQIQEFDGRTRHAQGLHGTREGGEERGMVQRDAVVQKHVSECMAGVWLRPAALSETISPIPNLGCY